MELFFVFFIIGFGLIRGGWLLGRSVGKFAGNALFPIEKPKPTYVDNSTTIVHHHHTHHHQNISIIDEQTKKNIFELKK